ncbi:hypothetical protein SK128_021610, partial [Halocaridina rubra]
GLMIMLSDKSNLVSAVMNVPLPEDLAISEPESDVPSVLIIDAMCIVSILPKTPEISNALHFAKRFVDIVADISNSYGEVRIAFAQYLTGSLKETTHQKQTVKTTPVHYHDDNTEIKNLKPFLSHVNTKAELTEYLLYKRVNHYQK